MLRYALAVVLPFASSAALAQSGVPLPSPMDVIQKQGVRAKGPCGSTLARRDVVRNDIQAAYAAAGRCDEYDPRLYTEYRLAAIGEEERPGDVTVAGYFAYHGLTWYQGRVAAASGSDRSTPPVVTDGDLGACNVPAADALEHRLQRVLARRDGNCATFDPERIAVFRQTVPPEQHYAVNYMAWVMGRALFPAAQARAMDAQID